MDLNSLVGSLFQTSRGRMSRRQQMRPDTLRASRDFFLAWLLAFVKSFSLVCHSRNWFVYGNYATDTPCERLCQIKKSLLGG